ALGNLRERTPADWLDLIDEETGIGMIHVGDCYDAARTLILDALLPETAAAGCWVAPLGRERVFLLPVALPALRHVHLLKLLAEKTFRGTPSPISDEVYWVHERQWYLFPIEIRDKNVTVTPPDEFVAALQLLEPGGEGDEGEEGGEAE